MLVVDHNTYSTHWTLGNGVNPLRYGGDVIITIDPSKTNMAIVFGTPDGYILNVLEFSGNNRGKGPTMDTTLYCEEVRAFLRSYLEHTNIYMVGVEQAIQKKGFEHYKSSMVLTEIRANILNFFFEVFGVKVIEINNWSWKFGVLPDGYRSQFEKGSKRWFVETMSNSPYSKYYEADVTDCICIYWYMVNKMCSQYVCYCNQYEKPLFKYEYDLMIDSSVKRELSYNTMFTLHENLSYYVNRIMGEFFILVPVSNLSFDDIYGHSIGFSLDSLNCEEVKVVARRSY